MILLREHWIAFSSVHNSNREIYVINSNGSEQFNMRKISANQPDAKTL